MSRLSAYFGSQGFLSDKRSVWINETLYYTWYQFGSHTKCSDHETTGLLETG